MVSNANSSPDSATPINPVTKNVFDLSSDLRTLWIIFFVFCSQWMIAVGSFINVTEEL